MTKLLFENRKPLIGVVHVSALPGTPAYAGGIDGIVKTALEDAGAYVVGGVDAVMLENMHDTPYERGGVGPEITAAMTAVACAVRRETDLPLGIQILAGANLEAMAVAHAAGLDFIRAEAYAFAHVADEGIIESSAAKLLRYRKLIGADRIQVCADIKKKHAAHAITADVSLGETAAAVEFMRGDVVIVSGVATGQPPNLEDLREAKRHCRIPVLLGSGIDVDNVASFFDDADGFIVGSSLKREGKWTNSVERQRVEALVGRVKELRSNLGAR